MIGSRGVVYLVGAGPGHPGLMTVLGRQILRHAEIVLTDRLLSDALLDEIPRGVEIVYVGKATGDHPIPQPEINRLLVEHAKKGRWVVRLKGGDPFMFGRGFEEVTACREAGVECYVVPGVTSPVAGPTAAGIPITHRDFVRSFAILTASIAPDTQSPPPDYAALAKMDTLVVLMGRAKIAEVTESLVFAGRDPATPAACIERATTPDQRMIRGTLANIAAEVEKAGLEAPVLTVIGAAAQFAAADPRCFCGPLAGQRVLVTRPAAAGDSLVVALRRAGAVVVRCPMIRIQGPLDSGPLDAAICALHGYDWIVFTSANAVCAFWQRLDALGLDTRALGRCRVAAIGPGTAGALSRCGVKPNVTPTTHTGEALAAAIRSTTSLQGVRILCPRSDIAPPEMPRRLRDCGATVDDVVAYRTVPATPKESVLERIRRGVEAIVFCSPSAVRRFVELGLRPGPAVVACIGPTTAAAVREAGLAVHVVAAEHHSDGLVAAMIDYWHSRKTPAGEASQ